jgi:high-affinity K+ transport system ATPase subunit B
MYIICLYHAHTAISFYAYVCTHSEHSGVRTYVHIYMPVHTCVRVHIIISSYVYVYNAHTHAMCTHMWYVVRICVWVYTCVLYAHIGSRLYFV